MKVKFVYTYSLPDSHKEKVIVNLYEHLQKLLKLPDTIVVEFVKMHDSQYAETLLGSKHNHIKLNGNFTVQEIFKPFIHEVIHLHQIHTNQLGIDNKGNFIWGGTKYNNDPNCNYENLPWEKDVANRLPKILESILRPY